MKRDIQWINKQLSDLQSMSKNLTDMPQGGPLFFEQYETFVVRLQTFIEIVSVRESPYSLRFQHILNTNDNKFTVVLMLRGVLNGLQQDIDNGYLTSLRELIHADIFSDLLDAADYFLSEGYKDPAAVMIGGVLEGHLRGLCTKNRIPLESVNNRGEMKPKMAAQMNDELAKLNVYGK